MTYISIEQDLFGCAGNMGNVLLNQLQRDSHVAEHDHTDYTADRLNKQPSVCHILNLPNDMLWEILSYLDRNVLVALATSCETIKLLVYSPQLWSDTELELNTRNSVNKTTALSFAVRNITRVRVTDGFNTCKLQKRKMSDEERATQKRNIDEASVAKTISRNNEWTRDYVKELFITLIPPKINKVPPENWSCFNNLQCVILQP